MPAVSTRTSGWPSSSIAGVDRIARGAGLVADDHAIRAEDAVHEGRLARVRPSHDRNSRRTELGLGELGHLLLGEVLGCDRYRRLGLGRWREALDDQVGEVAGVATVLCRDGDGRVEAEGVELDRIGFAGRVVALVDDEDHRSFGASQAVRDLVVERGDSGVGVHHEQDEIGLLHSYPCLLLDALLDVRSGLELQAAGVDHGEGAAGPLRGAVHAVAGGAGDIGDDRDALADEPVEERALADVGAADDRDHGQ